LAFVDAFNNTHCHNKPNTQIEHQKYKSKGSYQIILRILQKYYLYDIKKATSESLQ